MSGRYKVDRLGLHSVILRWDFCWGVLTNRRNVSLLTNRRNVSLLMLKYFAWLTNKEFMPLVWNAYYPVSYSHNATGPYPEPAESSPRHSFLFYKFYFNILTSTLISARKYLTFKVFGWNSVSLFYHCKQCYMPSPFYSPSFNFPNNTG